MNRSKPTTIHSSRSTRVAASHSGVDAHFWCTVIPSATGANVTIAAAGGGGPSFALRAAQVEQKTEPWHGSPTQHMTYCHAHGQGGPEPTDAEWDRAPGACVARYATVMIRAETLEQQEALASHLREISDFLAANAKAKRAGAAAD